MAAKNAIIIVVYSPVFCRWFYFPCCAIVLPQFRTVASAALGTDGHEAARRGGSLVQQQCLPGWRAGPAWLGLVLVQSQGPPAGVVSTLVLGSRILLPSAGNKQY